MKPFAPVLAPAKRPPAPAAPEGPRVLREGHRYGYFQALRLLSGLYGGTVGGPSYGGEAVRVRPDPAGVFPASDVKRIEAAERPRPHAEVTVTFGGLYGVDAALPAALHDHLRFEDDRTRPLRDFLDLFAHRFYALLWRAWARYRPESGPARATHERRALALGGMGTPGEQLPVPADRLLPFAGRLSMWARSAEGLQALLRGALDLPVRVRENVPRWVPIREPRPLGRARLGTDAVVGRRAYDEGGAFRLEVGPLGLDAYRDLLPGRPGAARLDAVVGLYAPAGLAFDVELQLRAEDAPRVRLGDAESARLGHSAWLGTPQSDVVRRIVRYDAVST